MANSLLQGLAGGARGLQQVLQLMAGQKFREQERSGQQEDALARLRERFRLEGELRDRLAGEGETRALESQRQELLEKVLALRGQLPRLQFPEVGPESTTEDLRRARLDMEQVLALRAQGQASAAESRKAAESEALVGSREASAAANRALAEKRGREVEEPEGPERLTLLQYQQAVRGELGDLFAAWRQRFSESGAEEAGLPVNLAELRRLHPALYETLLSLARQGIREDLGDDFLPPEVLMDEVLGGEGVDPDARLDAEAERLGIEIP